MSTPADEWPQITLETLLGNSPITMNTALTALMEAIYAIERRVDALEAKSPRVEINTWPDVKGKTG